MSRPKNYFAYGSNINLEQMAYRCPNAKVVGPVTLEGYELVFRGTSPYSGCGSIEPKEGGVVYGLLWKITPQCEQALNRYEGYPRFYNQQQVTVRDSEGKKHGAMVYVMTEQRALMPALPSKAYVECIRDGYRQNGMDTDPFENAVQKCCGEVAATIASNRNQAPKQLKKKKQYER